MNKFEIILNKNIEEFSKTHENICILINFEKFLINYIES